MRLMRLKLLGLDWISVAPRKKKKEKKRTQASRQADEICSGLGWSRRHAALKQALLRGPCSLVDSVPVGPVPQPAASGCVRKLGNATPRPPLAIQIHQFSALAATPPSICRPCRALDRAEARRICPFGPDSKATSWHSGSWMEPRRQRRAKKSNSWLRPDKRQTIRKCLNRSLLISFACAARSGRARGMILFLCSHGNWKNGKRVITTLSASQEFCGGWKLAQTPSITLSAPGHFPHPQRAGMGKARQRANAGNGSGSSSTAAKSMHPSLLHPASQSAADDQHPGIPVSDRLQKPKKFPRTAAAWREVRHCALHSPKKDGEQGTGHGKEKGREKRRPAAQT